MELTTELGFDIKAEIEKENENNSNDLLPYRIEYRKDYITEKNQPPEVNCSGKGFVFPNEKTNVYALTVILMELISVQETFANIREKNSPGVEKNPANRPTLKEFIKNLNNHLKNT